MTHTPQIYVLLEERARHAAPDWSIERAPALPAGFARFRLHLDLQLGPIFITIGEKIAS
ncbi:MAG: hypothetical protein RBS68_01925 [Anaerolineales bacterium]|jgi:hypothetical protein|nr:hypothetical protein [Anaerolineales bacterium]